jgi:hypothetical protein
MVEQTPKKEPLPLLGARTPRGSVPDEGGVTGFIVDSVQDALRAADVGAGLSRQTQSASTLQLWTDRPQMKRKPIPPPPEASRHRMGRLQRAVLRAFRASQAQALKTSDLLLP